VALADGQLALAAAWCRMKSSTQSSMYSASPGAPCSKIVSSRRAQTTRSAAGPRAAPAGSSGSCQRRTRAAAARVAAKEGHALQQLHRQLDARRLRVDRQPVTAQCVASICRNSHRSVAITLASRRSVSVSGDCRPASAASPKPTDVPGAPCSGAVGESSAGDYCSLPDSVVTLTVPASSTQNESCGLVSRSTTE